MDKLDQQSVADYIAYNIKEELKDVTKNKIRVTRSELYNEASSCFVFQIYFNKELNKIYLYYELDTVSKLLYNNDHNVNLRINRKLYNNFLKDTGHKLSIIGVVPYEKSEHIINQSSTHLRDNTFTYWKCFDGTYKFIVDKDVLISDREFWVDIPHASENIEKEENLIDFLTYINIKYNFNTNNLEDVPLAFEEYKTKYMELFGRELKPISNEDITYVYLNIIYDEND